MALARWLARSLAGSLAGSLAQDRTFKEQVTRPVQRHLNKIINTIIKEKTDLVEIRFKEATLTDEVALSQINERYLRNQAVTPNEVRESIGLPQISGGTMFTPNRDDIDPDQIEMTMGDE